MRVGILTQDNGSISPEKWAAESAAQLVDIIQIEPTSVVFQEMTGHKNAMQNELAAVLTPHHAQVQTYEQQLHETHGLDILDEHPVPEMDHLEVAVNAVREVAHSKPFGSHFDKPEVIEFVRYTLGSHFATVKQIERSYLADHNPETEQAKRFRARWHGANKGD